MRFTLGRDERLKRRKYIEELFEGGKSFSIYPLKIFYLIGSDSKTGNTKQNVQFGVGVSKKNFKKAVDRNRIKRLIKEAYRLQKNELTQLISSQKEFYLRLFVLYTGKEMPDYALIKGKVATALLKLRKKCVS